MHHVIKRSIHKASILYVDKGFVVCNKPPGLVCQMNDGEYHLGHLYKELVERLNITSTTDQPFYNVHRLDKETTGCLVLARTSHMARELSRQIQSRQVNKEYLALVTPGAGRRLELGMSGTVDVGLKDDDGRMSVGDSGHRSITHWRVLGRKDNLSLMRFTLETGLKHQIRVHAASVLGAPILGDTLHWGSRFESSERMYLHASKFSLYRYFGRARHTISVVAPLPKDFIDTCALQDLSIPSELTGGLFVDDIEATAIAEVDGTWLGEHVCLDTQARV